MNTLNKMLKEVKEDSMILYTKEDVIKLINKYLHEDKITKETT